RPASSWTSLASAGAGSGARGTICTQPGGLSGDTHSGRPPPPLAGVGAASAPVESSLGGATAVMARARAVTGVAASEDAGAADPGTGRAAVALGEPSCNEAISSPAPTSGTPVSAA